LQRVSIRAVFFDIDDTLIDHTTAVSAATVALYRSMALNATLEEFQSRWKAAHARHYPRFIRGEISYTESSRARVREAISTAMSDEAVDGAFAKYLAVYERSWTIFQMFCRAWSN
jgi:putative hydrolase of the HAD superfamily